jgi:uncharacterized protein involved in outer membrane biogenesis
MPSRSFKKVSLIVAAVLLVAFIGVIIVAQSRIDTATSRQLVVDVIKNSMQATADIEGGVSFSILPTPTLTVSRLTISKKSVSGDPEPTLYVEKMEVRYDLFELVIGKTSPSGMSFVRPKLTIERPETGNIPWGWLRPNVLQSLRPKLEQVGGTIAIEIADGTVEYIDTANEETYAVTDIQALGDIGTYLRLQSSMRSGGRGFTFSINKTMSDSAFSDTRMPLNIELYADSNNSITLQSLIDLSPTNNKISGKFALNTNDLVQWFPKVPEAPAPAPAVQGAKPAPEKKKAPLPVIPLSFGGDLSENDKGEIAIKDVRFKGVNSEGKGDFTLVVEDWKPRMKGTFDFDSLDYLEWSKLLGSAFFRELPTAVSSDSTQQATMVRLENPLPKDLQLAAIIKAKKLYAGKREVGSASLDIDMDKATLTVNQCDIVLPGDARLSIFGVISQGGTGDVRFEGNVETMGKSLRDAMIIIDASAKDLPDIGLKEFSASANMFVSAQLIRLTEMQATLQNTPFTGTILGYRGDVPRVEASIKTEKVDFDYIRDTLRERKIDDKAKSIDYLGKVFNFAWLKNIETRVDAKFFVDGFTFMEKEGERAQLSLYADTGDLRIYDVQLKYPDSVSDLSLSINVQGERPFANVVLNSDQLDTRYFLLDKDDLAQANAETEAKEEEKAAKEELSEEELTKRAAARFSGELIDYTWMDGFDGTFDITLRRLVHRKLSLDNLKLQSRLEGKRMNIQRFAFVYSRARCNVVGALFGGSVPGMNISITMANANLKELLQSLTGIENISGSASMSGTMSTSGLNYRAWAENMDARIAFAGRGVKVQGINLNGVNNILNVARTAADVFNNVNKTLPTSFTEFSADGSINMLKGEMRTPGITLKSGQVTGAVSGGLKLVPLTMQFNSLFRFNNHVGNPSPTLIVQLSGPLQQPEMKIDTSVLEAYVAKRVVGK